MRRSYYIPLINEKINSVWLTFQSVSLYYTCRAIVLRLIREESVHLPLCSPPWKWQKEPKVPRSQVSQRLLADLQLRKAHEGVSNWQPEITFEHSTQTWNSGASSCFKILKQTACCQVSQTPQSIIRPSSCSKIVSGCYQVKMKQ